MLQHSLMSGAVAQSTSSLSPLGVIDIAQVCELLGVSRTWVEKQIRADRTFPRCFKIGARRHVKITDLQAWVEAQARAA
jgi:predicted DNA-binding transcriptional regulator AlpA